VVDRDLRAYRVERALNSTLISATEYRRQLNDQMDNSASAIAYIQEGIMVKVNDSWIKLFRAKSESDVAGMPLMDNFRDESQAAIKGALVASLEGKWLAHEKLVVKSIFGDDDAATLELDFGVTDFDDSPAVEIRIGPRKAASEEPTQLVHNALKRDPTTLFYHRAEFLERLIKRLKRKPGSGLQAVAFIKPDNFADVRAAVGILDTEEILAQFSEEVRKRMHPRDVAGRFEGTVILALLERGNERDAEVWGQQLVDHIRDHTFSIGKTKVRLTCTVGVVGVSGVYANLEELIAAAADAQASGKAAGGNTVNLRESNDEKTRIRKYDKIWVNHIKTALKDNRFRLAQLPIAGLRSNADRMYDMLVRMIDTQGAAVLPSEFLAAAERNNLIRTIDRWMITSSIKFCAEHNAEKVFVKLSLQSMQDPELIDWLKSQFDQQELDPGHLCVQIPEQEAAKYIKETKRTVDVLHEMGVQFALEHYGIDKNRFQILDILKPNYIKIDGELMHSLTTDTALQESVRQVAAAAQQRNIETIAERVENANEMAVLFQLGVHFMQGHYVHEPEVVLQESVNLVHTTLAAIGSN
jgi:diguanylate cyclase (GGDEF)-like protein